MRVSVVQFHPLFKDLESNIVKVESYIKSIDSEMIIFPELCLSGYFYLSADEAEPFGIDFGASIMLDLADLAVVNNRIVVLGFLERSGGLLYNSAAMLFPDSKLNRVYRKTHLFYKEKFVFAAGDTGFFSVYYPEFDINVGSMICYDWRFPEAARALGLAGADLIACPSNLVTQLWHVAMPTRALENKVYVAVANRTGYEENGGEVVQFNGSSGIWKYNSDLITKAGYDDEVVLTTNIHPSQTRKKSFNEFNDVFKDRRTEFYK